MKFLRNNTYWILGVLIGIGIGISSIILIQRGNQQNAETAQHASDAEPSQQAGRIAQAFPRNRCQTTAPVKQRKRAIGTATIGTRPHMLHP